MHKSHSMMPFAYFRKEIIPSEKATISIASHSLQYGTMCFGGIRGYFKENRCFIFRLKDHFFRLQNSIKILGIPFSLSWEDFLDIITQLIKANSPSSNFYIRPFVFSENQALVPRFYGLDFNLAVYFMTLEQYIDPNVGLRLMISSWRKVPDTVMSTKAKAGGCYLNSALAKTEAIRSGYDEALLMDEQGNLVEASVANIFIVYQGEVITPEVGSSILEGITRRTVIELLKEEGIPTRQERIDRSMIYSSDEVFLTGTAVQILHAQSIDDRKIGSASTPGAICTLLQGKLSDLINKKHPLSSRWLTEF